MALKEMNVLTRRFANVWSKDKRISVIFSHLELWVAVSRQVGKNLNRIYWRVKGY